MSVQPSVPTHAKRPAMTLHSLMKMYSEGEKITMLTAYDATFAALADLAGVEVILVGDSLGMVCQGHNSTLPVTLDAMRYHTECVARGVQKQKGRPIVLGDMPFGTYATPEQAFRSASELMRVGAHMVKLEGGAWLTPDTVEFLVHAWHTGVWPYWPDPAKRQHLGRLPSTRPHLTAAAQQLHARRFAAGKSRCANAGDGNGACGAVWRHHPRLDHLRHHRHWCGCGHGRTDFGVARYVGCHPRQGAQVCCTTS